MIPAIFLEKTEKLSIKNILLEVSEEGFKSICFPIKDFYNEGKELGELNLQDLIENNKNNFSLIAATKSYDFLTPSRKENLDLIEDIKYLQKIKINQLIAQISIKSSLDDIDIYDFEEALSLFRKTLKLIPTDFNLVIQVKSNHIISSLGSVNSLLKKLTFLKNHLTLCLNVIDIKVNGQLDPILLYSSYKHYFTSFIIEKSSDENISDFYKILKKNNFQGQVFFYMEKVFDPENLERYDEDLETIFELNQEEKKVEKTQVPLTPEEIQKKEKEKLKHTKGYPF